MGKQKYREPSTFTLENDRSNHLGNAKNYLRSVVRIKSKINNSNLTDKDVLQLLNLSDKCSNTLRKYINLRNYMNKDELLKYINDKFSTNLSNTTFNNEIDWLSNFDECCQVSCNNFVQTPVQINLDSIQQFYRILLDFRRQFGKIYNPQNLDYETIIRRFDEYFEALLQIASGTGLVCEDGLKYYGNNPNFPISSVWLGSRMFLSGANSLLQIGGYEQSLIS